MRKRISDTRSYTLTFKKLLEGEEELPFVAFFKKRKIIIRDEFEEYMEDHPEIMEDLKNGKARVS